MASREVYRLYPGREVVRPRELTPRPSLPRPASSFVGREGALASITAAWREGARLVTVLGPPGMGKTRLALRFAELHDMTHAWFVDLTETRDAAEVSVMIARALAIPLPPALERPVTHIGAAIAERGPLLLVLDNFEQVVRVAASTLGSWLEAAPELRLLVTSRERLQIAGEVVVELGPLDLDTDAIQLFVDRARAAGGQSTEPSASDRASVASLVRELDGIPLAIELAAARTRVLSPTEIRARLARRFEVLATSGRSTRHSTLRSAIDSSWESLSPPEQLALAQCAVFAAGCTVGAAEAVLVLPPGAPSVLDVVFALRDKSLLHLDETSGTARLAQYVSIREYAAEKLAALDPRGETRARHADHYLSWARGANDGFSILGDPAQRRALARERDNLLAVFRWAVETNDATSAIEAALAVEPALSTHGPFDDLLAILDAAIARSEDASVDPRLAARLRVVRSNTYGTRGRLDDSLADLERALTIARAVGDRGLLGSAIVMMGTRRRQQARHEEAWACHVEARALLGDADRPRFAALNLASMGRLEVDFGHPTEGRLLDEEAATLARSIGDRFLEGLALGNLAQLDQETGDLDGARWHYGQALDAFRDVDELRYEAIYQGHSGDLAWEQGDLSVAVTRYVEAIAVLRRVRIPRAEGWFEAALGAVLATRGSLDEAQQHLDAARTALEAVGDPDYLGALPLHRLHLELARGEPASSIRARLDTLRPKRAPLDVRFALRMIDRAVALAPAPTPKLAPADPLRVEREADACVLPDGARIDLARRGAVRRVLWALVEHRLATPGKPLDADALLARGWPGERVLPDAAGKRVRVAIATLRALGLARWIVTRDGGYLLDPALPLLVEQAAT